MNNLEIILMIVILILGCVLIAFGIFLRIHPPKKQDVSLSNVIGLEGKRCYEGDDWEATECNTTANCDVCVDPYQMECRKITVGDMRRTGSDLKTVLVPTDKKYCLPKNITIPECEAKNGGVLALSGQGTTNRMEFNCLCLYPDYMGGNACKSLNPGVCSNGTWTFDATGKNKEMPPTSDDCECYPGFVRTGYPETCVPADKAGYYLPAIKT